MITVVVVRMLPRNPCPGTRSSKAKATTPPIISEAMRRAARATQVVVPLVESKSVSHLSTGGSVDLGLVVS